MRIPVTLLLTAACAACTSMPVSTASRPDAYYANTSTSDREGSLFAGDAATLSDEAINRILEYDYSPPALNRVALMPFGREIWSQWSEELSLASQEMQAAVIDTLRASPRVYDASYLPSILIPENRTVPHLREAAARYQADLLVVYRSFCQSFERYRIFSADKSRAFCGVEAVLLDTRTGLVPFTSVATHSYDVEKSDADMNFRETILRAQLEATATALGQVSGEIARFLASN
ncbi:MAG: hypothetical protein QNJ07_01160 [Woeseiaceae bacterium]|nr:hypothetical protein [Woeseiaceae bacterium]